MSFDYFSKNGEILPAEQAVVPLANIEYQYGFGVYETVRVINGVPYFLKEHAARLLDSADSIGLGHPFSAESVSQAAKELIEKNNAETCNLKILLIGAKTKEEASLYILCLNPLYPEKKLYTEGVFCITHPYERALPRAKTLNMLQSYLAYKKAKKAGAYEVLFVNVEGCVTEGSRSNFFCMQGNTVISPPENAILSGVTRKALMRAAEGAYTFEERPIPLSDISRYDGAFLTSTSAKLLPIRKIDSFTYDLLPPNLQGLAACFERFLKECKGTLK